MTALNFKRQHAELVRRGMKRQTIRARRRDGRDPKPGQELQLYVGQRTKSCELLRTEVCHDVQEIQIRDGGSFLDTLGRKVPFGPQIEVTTRGGGFQRLTKEQQLELAIRDGFTDVEGLLAFFRDTHGLPFQGLLIRW